LRHFSHDLIALLTQVDYARTMAFVALDPQTDEMLGVSRLVTDPDYTRAECAIMTRSDVKGQGIGWALMKRLIDYAAAENIGELWSEVTADNAVMLKMCDEFGFQMKHCPYDPCLMLTTLSLGGKKAA
jgi:acetyltransferase